MKMSRVTLVLLFLAILMVFDGVFSDLIVDKRCGQLSCDKHKYCSAIDSTCKDCSTICQRDHNFNAQECTQGCQDYLHDITYMRKDDEGSPESLKEEVRQLRTTLTATLTLVVLILIGIVIVLIIQAVKWCKNNKIVVQKFKNKFFHRKSDVTSADAKTIANPNARLDGGAAKGTDLRLDMPSSRSHHSDLPTPATLSTSISRRPAEDSTLDYAAYDNPAMRRTDDSSSDSPRAGGAGGGVGSRLANMNGERRY